MTKTILEMKDITKEFPGVKALDQVNLQVKEDQIHALVGENGAGKSTLMNVLSGVYPAGSYSGEIFFDNNLCQFSSIKESEKQGIVIIHQELALIPELSIAENLFLGNEQSSTKGVVNWNKTITKAEELLKKVGLSENPMTKINELGMGKQQLVEIAKAFGKSVKLLILDEPTAALNDEDSKNLLNLLKDLKNHGVTSVLISHKLNEVTQVADKITVLRNGKTIETLDNDTNISEARIIKGMVGRELSDRFPTRESNLGNVMLEVLDWNVYSSTDNHRKIVDSASFYVREGEVVGIAGLIGAGRTELAMSIFGKSFGSHISGKLLKQGQELHIKDIPQAIRQGFAYVTEDRKGAGLIGQDDIKSNISLPNLQKISKNQVINKHKEVQVGEEYTQKLDIKTPSIFQKVQNLSGGNQQKVILSKWMFTEPEIFFLDEPTRGIDVGAKYEIYTIMNQLVAAGKSVIMISSELPELLGMSDRIYIMNEGTFVGELPAKEATQESIMKHIMDNKRMEYRGKNA